MRSDYVQNNFSWKREAKQKKNIPLVINILSALLKRTTNQNDELTASQQYRRHPPSAAKAFSGLVIPTISIRRYLEHIYFNTDCSTCCYVIAFIYLDRFLYFNPSVRLDFFNVHRFLITAILTSVKFMDERILGTSLRDPTEFWRYLEIERSFSVTWGSGEVSASLGSQTELWRHLKHGRNSNVT
ncbi:cyclin-P4-1-like [Dendrobium catenatum]|uniref:Cyclin-P4-1 n=1 Tax=Dendrobium catenatum TaxID=906689 RepID=A0A2I0WXU4_9ASPA|nr:cyclin-P4-1-like [Dendrobium catenatum]PKU80467.1 Cyclin-P4-1 [Dendrobium catenatum]